MSTKPFEFKVNGVSIKTPTFFDIEFQPITEGERLLDATLRIEGVADKHVVILAYDLISEEDLAIIFGETWSAFRQNKGRIKQTITFPYFDGKPITINTYFAPMRIRRSSSSYKNGSWENFELKFIEC